MRNLKKHLMVLMGVLGLCQPVCSTTHRPQDFLDGIAGTKGEGQAIVEHYCATCHAAHPLIALGAPRMGHAEDWEARRPLGLSVLYEHVAQGYGAMPARGGCFECTDAQLQAAIEALLK